MNQSVGEISEKSKRQIMVLSAALAAIADTGKRAWLTDGTLLGFIRERDFIAHDHDMDLGMLINDLTPELIQSMVSHGFRLDGVRGTPDNGLEYTFEKNNELLDIFFFYKRGNQLWHSAWLKKKYQINFIYDQFEIRPALFHGIDVWIPDAAEIFLEKKYGPGWIQKETSWSWAFSPKNVKVPVKHIIPYYKIWIKWKTKKIRYTIKDLFIFKRTIK